jgi:hypothetical protein
MTSALARARVLLVALVLPFACVETSTQESCGYECIACESDDDCPLDAICRSRLFGASCGSPRTRLCSTNLQCASHEHCTVRRKPCGLLCEDPGPTRRTCEPRDCTTDEMCGPGNSCVMALFSDRNYCSPTPPPDTREPEDAHPGEPDDAADARDPTADLPDFGFVGD